MTAEDAAERPDGPEASTSEQELHRAVEACIEAARNVGVQRALDDACARAPHLAQALRRRVRRLEHAGLLDDEPEPDDALPERLGDYRLLRRLGAGGMGVVYLARQESLERDVAVKIVRPELLFFPGARARFRREVEAISRMQHPGIATVYAVGEERNIPYLAMEFIAGATLSACLSALHDKPIAALRGEDLWQALCRQAGAPPTPAPPTYRTPWIQACLGLTIAIGRALAHVHGHGIVHRDVKPSNVMLGLDGRVCLLDFGLAASDTHGALTNTGAAVGSVPYMAPEQVRGDRAQIGPWTDVWALGVLLHELLTLQAPFGGSADEGTRSRILSGEAAPLSHRNPSVSWDLRTVCTTALQVDPAARYQSAAAFTDDLERVLSWRPIAAKRPGAWHTLRGWARRHPGWAVGAAAALLATVLGPLSLWLLTAHQRDRAVAARAEAERQTYAANIAAAELASRAQDARLARFHLERCPTELRGFEWDHLHLIGDSSLWHTAEPAAAGITPIAADPRSGTLVLNSGRTLRVRRDAGLGDTHTVTVERTLRAHTVPPGGQRVLALDEHGKLVSIDLATGQLRELAADIRADARLESVGDLLVAREGNVRLLVLDGETGRELRRHELDQHGRLPDFTVHRGTPMILANIGATLDTIELRTGTRHGSFTLDSAARAAGSPDGEKVVVWRDQGGVLSVHTLADGKKVAETKLAAERLVECIYVGNDLIAVGLPDGGILVLREATMAVERVLLGHTRPASTFHGLGSGRFATWSFDNTIRVWSAVASPASFELPTAPPARSELPQARVTALAAAPRGHELALGNGDGVVMVCDARDGMPRLELGRQRRRVRALHFAADAPLLFAWADDNTLVAYDLTTGAVRADLSAPGAGIERLCATSDGAVVTGFTADAELHVFDLREHRHGKLPAPAAQGALTAVGDRDSVWWQDRQGVVRRFRARDRAIDTLAGAAVPPHLRTMALPTWPRVAAAALTETMTDRHGTRDVSLIGNADGTRFWTGALSGHARIWHGATAEPLLTLQSQSNAVQTLAATADETLCAGGSSGARTFFRSRPSPRQAQRQHDHLAARAWLADAIVEPKTRAELHAAVQTARDSGALAPQVAALANELIAVSADDAERWLREAQAIASVGLPNQAEMRRGLRFVERALRERPDWAAALGCEALLATRTRQFDRAIAAIERALQHVVDPAREPEPEWLAVAATAHMRAGRREQAEQMAARMHELVRDPRFAGDLRADLFRRSVDRLLGSEDKR